MTGPPDEAGVLAERHVVARSGDSRSAGRGALPSVNIDVMCRVKSSGTVAVGISASGSSVIAALVVHPV